MTLADKGWTDLPTYARLFMVLGTDGWKRYGSSFLLLAIFLNILGSVISPLQEIFLSTKTIKAPTIPSEIMSLLDIPDKWQLIDGEPDYRDDNMVVVMTRNTLISTTNIQRQAQLWEGENVSCAFTPSTPLTPIATSESCTAGDITFGNFSMLHDPFLAELPSGFNTGLLRQYLPRINSSARYENISKEEFPTGCNYIDGAFYVDYTNTTTNPNEPFTWGIQACMPYNASISPWNPTRDRQDFTEELYLNITLVGYLEIDDFSGTLQNNTFYNNTFYKVTLNTTAGYFELPNYMNSGSPGPLLDKDPDYVCGTDCPNEGGGIGSNNTVSIGKLISGNTTINIKRQHDETETDNSTFSLEGVRNKGPLLTIAMALFGKGSFIQTRQAHTQAYGSNLESMDGVSNNACVDLAPLSFLLADPDGTYGAEPEASLSNTVRSCITNNDGGGNGSKVYKEITKWLYNFNYDTGRLSNAFTSAAYLANQAWMQYVSEENAKSLTISFDLGADTQKPSISRGGLITISLLLGLDILILLLLAIYASWSPRWTTQLDSFAMMRIGAAVSEKVPLLLSREQGNVKVLDQIPGWIGDETEANEPVGKLALGGSRSILERKNSRFECFQGDDESISNEERKIKREIDADY